MKNKIILITGGTTGIGLATAQLLSAEGAKVIVTGRNPETLAAAQKLLPSSVVFNSSVAAQVGFPTTSIYSATKAGVVSFGKTLAVELAPRGIRVNVVSPGPVET